MSHEFAEGHHSRSTKHTKRVLPRAEHVANELRSRIIAGDLADGTFLPKQDDLMMQFGISRPSMREALRILETEGLLSVRRGKLGGAVVHRPGISAVANILEMVMQSQAVSLEDISAALRSFEPVCAGLCAERSDRLDSVVPRLRDLNQRAEACIDDVRAFTAVSRQFHEELVAGCGNSSVIITIGALERIWSDRASAWADQQLEQYEDYPDLAFRRRGLDDHEVLVRLIERGDAEGAAREARAHFATTPIYETREAPEGSDARG